MHRFLWSRTTEPYKASCCRHGMAMIVSMQLPCATLHAKPDLCRLQV